MSSPLPFLYVNLFKKLLFIPQTNVGVIRSFEQERRVISTLPS